jgi:hypothetical protein
MVIGTNLLKIYINNIMTRLSKRLSRRRQRKSKTNRMFRKRGGGGQLEQEVAVYLGKLERIRREDGDLSAYNTAQLIAKSRELRNASDGVVSLESAAAFGKKQLAHSLNQISKYTDDLIKELLKFDPNSFSTFLIENKFIENINQAIIRDYLPISMWRIFGGVSNVFNWMLRQLMETNTFPKSETPPLHKDDLLHIFQTLKEKYPTIHLQDAGIRELILKDVLKKLYYLDDPGSIQKLQSAGKPIQNPPSDIKIAFDRLGDDFTQGAKKKVEWLGSIGFKMANRLVILCAILFWFVLNHLNYIIEYDANVGASFRLKPHF